MNDNLRDTAERGAFSGKIGYVLATAGSAVGLGNIWRFPYLAASYGGGIFLLVYLLLALTFGYTLMMSESTGDGSLCVRMRKEPCRRIHCLFTKETFQGRRLDQCRNTHADTSLLQRYRRLGLQISL